MRIAVNASILDSRPTGLGVYTREVIREMAAVMDPKDEMVVFTATGEPFKGLDLEIRGLPSIVEPHKGKAAGVARFIWTQTALAAHVARGGFDVVYNTTHHGIMSPLRVPQVVTLQNDMDVAFAFPDQHRLQYTYYKYVMGSLLHRSAAIITTSEYAKGTIERRYPGLKEPIYVAYNGFDPAVFNTTPAAADNEYLAKWGLSDAPYILVVNASYPHKNLGVVLSALPLIADHSVKVCVAGFRAQYVNELLAHVPAELRARLVIIPQSNQNDLRALYQGAALMAMPSFHESFGMPVIEAMACGCPVVTSNASSLPEVAGDAALYFDPRDAGAFAAHVDTLLADPATGVALRNRGLAHCQPFRWRTVAEIAYNALRYAIE